MLQIYKHPQLFNIRSLMTNDLGNNKNTFFFKFFDLKETNGLSGHLHQQRGSQFCA